LTGFFPGYLSLQLRGLVFSPSDLFRGNPFVIAPSCSLFSPPFPFFPQVLSFVTLRSSNRVGSCVSFPPFFYFSHQAMRFHLFSLRIGRSRNVGPFRMSLLSFFLPSACSSPIVPPFGTVRVWIFFSVFPFLVPSPLPTVHRRVTQFSDSIRRSTLKNQPSPTFWQLGSAALTQTLFSPVFFLRGPLGPLHTISLLF